MKALITRFRDWLSWRQTVQAEESRERVVDRSEELLRNAVKSSAETHDLLTRLTEEMQQRGGYRSLKQ